MSALGWDQLFLLTFISKINISVGYILPVSFPFFTLFVIDISSYKYHHPQPNPYHYSLQVTKSFLHKFPLDVCSTPMRYSYALQGPYYRWQNWQRTLLSSLKLKVVEPSFECEFSDVKSPNSKWYYYSGKNPHSTAISCRVCVFCNFSNTVTLSILLNNIFLSTWEQFFIALA